MSNIQVSSNELPPLNERVVDFIYVLLRDAVLPGDMENILRGHVEHRDDVHPVIDDWTPNEFTNKGLEQYARNLAARLHAFVVPPVCDCGAWEGTRAHTAYEGNWGGHAINCPRRDYANLYEGAVNPSS